MTRQLTQGEVEYLRRLFSLHNKIGEMLSNLMVAIASDSEQDVAKSHEHLRNLAGHMDLMVESDYGLIYKSKPVK